MNPQIDPNVKLSIYFDGACHLCSREIEHYAKQNSKGHLRFVNIALPSFDQIAEGFKPEDDLHKVMHVKTADGKVHTRVEAFIAIWSVLPGYGILSSLMTNSFVRPLAELGYSAFAHVRPYLPKRKADECDTGYCQTRR